MSSSMFIEKSRSRTHRERREGIHGNRVIYSQMTEYNNGGTLSIISSWLELSEWQKDRLRHRLTCKHLFTTTEESCVEISADNFRPREDLTSTQEEADTRLLLHASHAARNGFKAIVISSEDTDVFVLCLAFKDFVPAGMYLECGTQTRTRFVSITNVFERHGSRICKCLPGLHAFTGCDSVSAFSGKGKLTALKFVKRRPA